MYKLSKSLSTNPEVSEDTEDKKILLHMQLSACLHFTREDPENSQPSGLLAAAAPQINEH